MRISNWLRSFSRRAFGNSRSAARRFRDSRGTSRAELLESRELLTGRAISFDSLAFNSLIGAVHLESGFAVSSSVGSTVRTSSNSWSIDQGTTMFNSSVNAFTTVSRPDGGNFQFVSIDLNSLNGNQPAVVPFNTTSDSGSVSNFSWTTDSLYSAFQTFAPASGSNLSSIRWQQVDQGGPSTDFHQFDNIILQVGPAITATSIDGQATSTDPIDSIALTLDEVADLATFTHEDLVLTRNGSSITLDASVTVSHISGTTYEISGLSPFTSVDGEYSLTINALGIRNPGGLQGMGTSTEEWVKTSPPRVVATSFSSTGTLPAESSSLTVTFDQPLSYGLSSGALDPQNYELRRADIDGLLLQADAAIQPSHVNISGNTVTLSFPVLEEDLWRLTIRDEIVNEFGVALDGDGDALEGGSWQDDFLVQAPVAASSVAWVRQFGTGGHEFANGISATAAGDSIVVGSTPGSLDGIAGAGSEDGFIRKLNSSGQHVWTRLIGSASGDSISDSRIDSAGNIYVVGNTSGTLPGQVSAGGPDAFLQKLDVNGNVIWTRQFGTISSDDAFALAVDGTGNVYVAGRTQGVLPGQFSSGSFDAFLRKYDSVGNVVWTSQFGSAGIDQSNAVSVDLNGDILVAGMTEGALPGQVSAGGRDIFVRKYHSSGAVQWTRQFGTSGLDSANGLDTDQYGAIYLSGETTGTFGGQLSLGGYDAIVQKLSPQGTLLWTRQFGTSASDSTSGILIDPQGSVVVSGTTAGSFPGQSNYGAYDLFIQRFESDGDSISTWQYGSATDDVVASLATDAMGNLYAAGGTGGSLAGQAQAGGFDGLVLKFSGTVLETPDGLQILVDPTGPGAGQLHASGSAAIDGLNRLQIDGNHFVVSNPAFSLDDLQQTIVLATQPMAGLDITREITVPSTGAYSSVRTLDTFTNSSGSPRTASVRVVGNLGSDESTTVFATSSGDSVVDASDWWIGTDDGDGTGTPAVIHLIRGPAGLTPANLSVTEDNVEWTYELNLGAGETQRLAYLTILGATRAEAIAAAAGLVSAGSLSSEAAAYLTANEIESLANFQSGTLSATLDGSGNLTVADSSDRPNGLTIELVGTDLLITDAAEQFASIPAGGSLTNGGRTLVLPGSLVSGWLVLNTAGGDDSIEIDFTNGNLIPGSGISVNGGSDESDELRIVGGNQGNVTYSDTDGNTGRVQMSSFGQINYSGLSFIRNTGDASNVVISLPVAASATVLEDDGLQGNNLSQIRATSVTNYRIAFTNPSGQLRIMPGTSANSIQVSSLPDLDASLQFGQAESAFGNIEFTGSVALTAARHLTAFALNEIAFQASADLQLSNVDGLLELTAKQFHIASAADISGSGAQITADRMDFAGTLSATSTVTLQPITAGQLIDLGSASDALTGTLALADAELDRISAGFLKIGSNNSGAMSITQPISPAGSGTLHLISGAGVTQTAPIVVAGLAVQAAGAVSLQSSANDVDTIALRTSVGNIAFEDADGFSVGDVDGVSGISAPAGRPSLLAFTGDIVITNSAAAIDVEGQAGFNMVVNQFGANSKFTLAAGASMSGGSVQITADRLDISGTINALAAVTLQATSSGRMLQLGSGSDIAPNALELSDAELDRISTSVLRLGGFGTGTISIDQPIHPATSSTLHLVTAAGVTQTSPITVANLAVQAAGTVNLSGNNDVDTVALRTTVGHLTFADSDGFTIGTINGVSGVSAAAGAPGLTAFSGDVLVANTPAANDLEGGTGFNMNITLFGPAATFRIASGAHVSGSGAQITADRMDFAGTLSATSTVTLQPITAGQLIDLGSASDALAGTLALADAELDRISAGFLKIGSNNSGAMSITQPISPAGSGTLHLISGAGVTQTAPIVVPSLALQAAGTVSLSDNGNNANTIALRTTSGNLAYTDSNGFTIGTVNGVSGFSATGAAAMNSITGDVIVSNTPAANDLEGGTGFNMNITLSGPAATFRIASGVHVSGSGAQITADRMDFAGTLSATSTVTLQPITAGQLIDLGSASDALTGTLALADAELDRISAGFLKIGSNNSGAMSITQPISPAGSGTLHLISGAGVTQTVSGSVAVSQLAVQAIGPVIFDGYEEGVRFNQVSTLAGLASGSGSSFQFVNKGSLTVGTVNGVTGISANGGGIQITTHSPLTLNAAVSETGGGGIRLIAGNDGGGDDHLTVNASILASGGSGHIELSAGTDLILGAGTAVSASGSGTISVSATETTAISTTASILAESGIILLETQGIVVTDTDPTDDIGLVPVEGSSSVELTINGVTLVFSPIDESEPIRVETEDESGQANSFPSANAGSDRLEVEGVHVQFGGSFTDPDIDDTHLIRWDFGDGSAPVEGTLTPTHSYADNGVYTVTLTVTDAGGLRSEDRLLVIVSNAPPVAATQSYSTMEDRVLAFNVLSGADNNGAFAVVDPGAADTHTAIAGTYPTTNGGSVVIAANGESLYTPAPGYSGTDSVSYSIQDDDGAVSSGEVTINVQNLVDVSGRVFRDLNNDGLFQPASGETGIAGLEMKLVDQSSNDVIAVVETDVEGKYFFDANLGESRHYRIERADVSGWLDGRESVGNLGGFVNNQFDSAEIRDIPVGDPGETTDAIDYLFSLIPSSQVQGLVWEDFSNDGEVNFGEKAIQGTSISLTGTDDRGNGVSLSMATDAQGIFEFVNLRPGNYSLTQTQSAGFSDGQEIVGTINGVVTGQTATNDQITGIVMNQPGSIGANYNFAERPLAGAAISSGQTAGIGFWQNKHGQQLIKSLNGGSGSTALGSWLAATLPNMYGADAGASDLTGKTNAQVAEFYMSLFKRNGKSSPGGPPKLDAQVLATALAVYVTNHNLAGTTAAAFGFVVSETGVGSATLNVGTNGAAFGVSNHSAMTVLDVLLAVNERTRYGLLFDVDGSGQITQLESVLREMADRVFSDINE